MAARPSFLAGMLHAIFERGRANAPALRKVRGAPGADLPALCRRLIGDEGEASRVALAADILARWSALDEAGQLDFLMALAEGFGPDPDKLDRAIDAYRAAPGADTVSALHYAAEPPRQDVLRRLNLAALGTLTLVRMREAALKQLPAHPALKVLDADFVHLFSSWFNRGFLVLRRIDWSSPANILEKIIRYEAVHEIKDWTDLRRRLEPADRRCFAFFHPALVDEPLIFVEVALLSGIPSSIGALLEPAPEAVRPNTAVFYSISNCQAGLRGVSFGDFLIKQVVDELKRELPELKTFVTLSPVPGFAAWLAGASPPAEDRAALAGLQGDWHQDPAQVEALRQPLLRAAATYFLKAKTPAGKPLDPVARFHLNNGASLHRIHMLADSSPRALREAHGLMVNYCYEAAEIEANHERFAREGHVAASPEVTRLLEGRDGPGAEPPVPRGPALEAVADADGDHRIGLDRVGVVLGLGLLLGDVGLHLRGVGERTGGDQGHLGLAEGDAGGDARMEARLVVLGAVPAEAEEARSLRQLGLALHLADLGRRQGDAVDDHIGRGHAGQIGLALALVDAARQEPAVLERMHVGEDAEGGEVDLARVGDVVGLEVMGVVEPVAGDAGRQIGVDEILPLHAIAGGADVRVHHDRRGGLSGGREGDGGGQGQSAHRDLHTHVISPSRDASRPRAS
jgi:malonyl-CoA decarboxylase